MTNKILNGNDISVVVRGDLYVWGSHEETVEDSPVNIVMAGLSSKEAYRICLSNNMNIPGDSSTDYRTEN